MELRKEDLMMVKYSAPEMEIIAVKTEDIILASRPDNAFDDNDL